MGQNVQASLFPAKQSSAQGPWRLPEGWEWVRLDQRLVEMQSGFACARKHSDPTGLPHLRPFNVGTDGEIDLSQVIRIPINLREDLADFSLRAGDVLFNNTNSVELVGKTAIVREPLECAFSNHLTRLHVRAPDRLDPRWLALALRLLQSQGYFAQRCNKWIGQAGFNPTKLAEVLIPRPSLNIQRRIVARIEALLAEVKEARALAAAIRRDTDRLLAAAVHEVFTSLHPIASLVPLKKIAQAFNGRASGEGISTVRVFKTKHVYPHCLRLDRPSFMKAEQVKQMPKDRYLQSGDVLMANIAEGTLGRVTYVLECEESWTVDTQVMILRSLDDRNLLLGKWLYYYLWSERGQQEILARRSGIAFADKRGQTHIYPKNVWEIPVPLPPIEKQIQAVAQLDSVQAETEEMRRLQTQDAELLDQLEQSILERAFRGEL